MVVVAGLLVALAFKPFGIWPLAILGYALFVKELEVARRPILDSWLFGLTSSLIILKWSDIYVGVVPYLALALLQSLFSIPLGAHVKYLKRSYLLPVTFLAFEYLREIAPFGGFSWTQLGFSQIDAPYRNLAAMGGVFLISAFIFAIASMKNVYQGALVAVLLIPGLLLLNPRGEGEELKIAAIQGTSPDRSTNYASDIDEVFRRHFTLSKKVSSAEIIVWPEDVLDGAPHDKKYIKYFNELQGKDLIIGNSPYVDSQPENLSTHISADGKVESVYSKQSLVPFGEYVPLRSIVKKLNSHVGEVIDYRPGRETVVHIVRGQRLTSLICFEIIDNSIVRKAAHESHFMVAQTNTSTFRGTYEAEQQFAITRMRAIEYSRPILSVSTVGYTAFIDNNGRVESQAKLDTPSILYGTMVGNGYTTLYSRFPFLAPIFIFFFVALGRKNR